jgi:hypothetical protein
MICEVNYFFMEANKSDGNILIPNPYLCQLYLLGNQVYLYFLY